MRLGAPLFEACTTPEEWVAALREHGYSAAYCPVGPQAPDDVVAAYERAAAEADIVIAEVGAWSNPISPDEAERAEAREKCKAALALADRIGARCCVNIAGSRGEVWHGPHPDDLTEETFDLIVATTREIIDAVKPTRTYYTLETMPWMYPDSPDSYLRLIEAVDRDHFGVHLDPVNLINSPERFFHNGAFLEECFAKLGPYIKSCHAKDVAMSGEFLVHLDEVRPGLGKLDYRVFLREAARLPDMPIMLEHLPTAEEFALAAEYLRSVARGEGLEFV